LNRNLRWQHLLNRPGLTANLGKKSPNSYFINPPMCNQQFGRFKGYPHLPNSLIHVFVLGVPAKNQHSLAKSPEFFRRMEQVSARIRVNKMDIGNCLAPQEFSSPYPQKSFFGKPKASLLQMRRVLLTRRRIFGLPLTEHIC